MLGRIRILDQLIKGRSLNLFIAVIVNPFTDHLLFVIREAIQAVQDMLLCIFCGKMCMIGTVC